MVFSFLIFIFYYFAKQTRATTRSRSSLVNGWASGPITLLPAGKIISIGGPGLGQKKHQIRVTRKRQRKKDKEKRGKKKM